MSYSKNWGTYLIAAWTRPEPLVGEVELLHAQRTCLFFVIVDELVLLSFRHGGLCKDETRAEGDVGGEVKAHPDEPALRVTPGCGGWDAV